MRHFWVRIPEKNSWFGANGLTSDAKVEANRRNALKSSGPKDRSMTRFNALKHGLKAREVAVMPYKDPARYARLLEALRED